MTLREQAEKAARKICGPSFDRSGTFDTTYGDIAVDAIERVAKAFAERAVREFGSLEKRGYDSHDDGLVDEAIAVAERGE